MHNKCSSCKTHSFDKNEYIFKIWIKKHYFYLRFYEDGKKQDSRLVNVKFIVSLMNVYLFNVIARYSLVTI